MKESDGLVKVQHRAAWLSAELEEEG